MEIFGSSGFRGVVDRGFMETAFRLGLATGSLAQSVVVASDTRTSSDAVKHCVVSGLLAAGCKAFDAGTVPTPTLAYNCREFQAGVMVTASHNPPEYNGIKLWNPDGSAFNSDQRRTIEGLVTRRGVQTASWKAMKHLGSYPEAAKRHLSRILQDFPKPLNLKVVVDCGCGAGSLITPHLLESLGCQVIALNCYPSGFFPRGIEPVPENLEDLKRMVLTLGADMGVAHDADADRLTVVDEKGECVPGDKLLVLLAQELKAKMVVTTIDTSMTIEEQGFDVVRTRVGDAYVSEELRRQGDFGAEPSGAWIFPRVSYCPDGVYAAALVTRIADRERLSLQIDHIPSYPMRRGSTPGDRSLMSAIEGALEELAPLSVDHADGIRLTFSDSWLLVRPSGTESKVRVTVEAKTPERADSLYQSSLSLIESVTTKGKGTRRK